MNYIVRSLTQTRHLLWVRTSCEPTARGPRRRDCRTGCWGAPGTETRPSACCSGQSLCKRSQFWQQQMFWRVEAASVALEGCQSVWQLRRDRHGNIPTILTLLCSSSRKFSIFKSLQKEERERASRTRNLRSCFRSLRSAVQVCPKNLKSNVDHNFSVAKLWNVPPPPRQNLPPPFKLHLKTHFYSLVFNPLWELCGLVPLNLVSVFLCTLLCFYMFYSILVTSSFVQCVV